MKLVVTSQEDDISVKCQFCNKEIASFVNDNMTPPAEQCYKSGNVPIPNFGWFCSQDCAAKYELKFDIKFSRTEDGKVDYYNDNL